MMTFSILGRFGRIGNQLFQIASMIGISKDNEKELWFPQWHCDYTKKNMNEFFENKLNFKNNSLSEYSLFKEKQFNYDKIFLDKEINYDFLGYFQSDKYFKKYESEIRKQFEPSRSLLHDLKNKFAQSGLLYRNTCSVHIRRGDYVNNEVHDGICTLEYYAKAIEFIKSRVYNPKFVVFSDDIKWCKENFDNSFYFVENSLSQEGDVIHRTNNSDVEELFLMSMCSHNIIANSSFSWWASYLNKHVDKIIVAPNRWFSSDYKENFEDIYTSNMIRL